MGKSRNHGGRRNQPQGNARDAHRHAGNRVEKSKQQDGKGGNRRHQNRWTITPNTKEYQWRKMVAKYGFGPLYSSFGTPWAGQPQHEFYLHGPRQPYWRGKDYRQKRATQSWPFVKYFEEDETMGDVGDLEPAIPLSVTIDQEIDMAAHHPEDYLGFDTPLAPTSVSFDQDMFTVMDNSHGILEHPKPLDSVNGGQGLPSSWHQGLSVPAPLLWGQVSALTPGPQTIPYSPSPLRVEVTAPSTEDSGVSSSNGEDTEETTPASSLTQEDPLLSCPAIQVPDQLDIEAALGQLYDPKFVESLAVPGNLPEILRLEEVCVQTAKIAEEAGLAMLAAEYRNKSSSPVTNGIHGSGSCHNGLQQNQPPVGESFGADDQRNHHDKEPAEKKDDHKSGNTHEKRSARGQVASPQPPRHNGGKNGNKGIDNPKKDNRNPRHRVPNKGGKKNGKAAFEGHRDRHRNRK
ncbi:uncharacterized protein F5Z01DRAFT_223932 [Emericellopsis atlantica]|uniref:Uncharacterized protein n=1 Tax=Emericellopsis atlantica TaxID=2614577 RepID=A0A9P7ZJ86_9HYPO|nr:uncharacterized protein F5Z01DRAFT_223932 [Emericellopsis atlantica]KAG9252726.1 hypothetical protein F5Z01DRAFT_223932 [Emericellopsis atlantica]